MYSNLVSIQILISLLKKHNIKHLVISAGQSNNSFARSVEHDNYFRCYSVVDERSAAFFAIGLSLQLNEPVAISCTASTACTNYVSAITEAYYRQIPIVVLTSNYDIRRVDTLKLLSIHQENVFKEITKKEVQLPEVLDARDFTYCERLINEALLETNHHGKGPVHIDIPSYGNSLEVNVETLPETRFFARNNLRDDWSNFAKRLDEKSKIMVICGQDYYSDETIEQLKIFSERYECIIAGEHMANVKLDGFININPIVNNYSYDSFKEISPSIIITLGRHVQFDWMALSLYGIEHWSVNDEGAVIDSFNSLTNIFESSIFDFLKKLNEFDRTSNNHKLENIRFKNDWNTAVNSINVPDMKLCHIYAIQKFYEDIPKNSIVHLSVFNSIRISQYFKLPEGVKCYANLGALGIDGSMSTFIGHACATEQQSYIIIGDLSFFYDMNSLMIKHISKNIRILLLNNNGGAEFYQNNGWYDTLDQNTAAKHSASAKGWVESNNFIYISARNKTEYMENLKVFNASSEKPIVLEVFTNLNDDMEAMKQLKMANKKTSAKEELKNKAKVILGQELTNKIKKVIKK